MALLHGLVNLRDRLGIEIHVGNLNHELRGKESDADSQLVCDVSAKLKVSCTIKSQSVADYQKKFNIGSIEFAAREVRYHFLTNLADQLLCDAITLGHTADDQAETVLMNLIRGSGLQGLTGMSMLSKWSGRYKHGLFEDPQTTLFRPLLTLRKSDTIAYCVALDIPYNKDSTNYTSRFTRGKIRNNLLPNLLDFNPKAVDAILRASRSAQTATNYLESEINSIWSKTVQTSDGSVTLNTAKISTLHPALLSVLLQRAFVEATGGVQALNENQLLTMIKLLGKNSGSTLDLPSGITFRKEGPRAFLEQTIPTNLSTTITYEHKITIPGISLLPGWEIASSMVKTSGKPQISDQYEIAVDADQLGDNVIVRTRRSGDRFWPLGMPGEIKLNRFFINEKIPWSFRAKVPLLVTNTGIQWVVGYRISDRVKITPKTSNIIKISFLKTTDMTTTD